MSEFSSQILTQKREIVAQLRRDSSVNVFVFTHWKLEDRCAASSAATEIGIAGLKIIANLNADHRRRNSWNLSADEPLAVINGAALRDFVLTDEAHFGGSIADLALWLPRPMICAKILLLIDPGYEGAIAGADAYH
jgi:hypothetical protein